MHITVANLVNKFHRSLEPTSTQRILRAIFPDENLFVHHAPLPSGDFFSDEGAANHTRFCRSYAEPGVHLFVYGRTCFAKNAGLPQKYPARQTLEASQCIARLHQLDKEKVVYVQQNPQAIDAGVFHNDVAAVGNQSVFFYHENAFVQTSQVIDNLRKTLKIHCQCDLIAVDVKAHELSLEEAVASYLFNSQIVTCQDGSMALIAPAECQKLSSSLAVIEKIVADSANPIQRVYFLPLRESMRNGGGPACLRLRVVLSPSEIQAVNPHVFLNASLYAALKKWIVKHYREKLHPSDLADPLLLRESQTALDELTSLLHLGSIYPFQKCG